MNIVYKQTGPCTNSSSAHCIVYLKDHNLFFEKSPIDDNKYGWEMFVIKSKISKIYYLIAYLKYFIKDTFKTRKKIEEFLDIINTKYNISITLKEFNKMEVEHNSLPSLNIVDKCRKTMQSRTKLLLRYLDLIISQDEFVIFGGNDNGYDYEEYFKDQNIESEQRIFEINPLNQFIYNYEKFTIFIFDNTQYKSLVKRSYKFIVTDDDIKSGDELIQYIIENKIKVPPLQLDVKITDKCSRGCKYCYQKSTPNGKECNLNIFKDFLYAIRYQPIEVAIGGGDITEISDMKKLIEIFKSIDGDFDNKIRLNVTIRPEKIKDILKEYDIGGINGSLSSYTKNIGISIENVGELKLYENDIKKLSKSHLVCFHIIAELIPEDEVILILDWLKYSNLISDSEIENPSVLLLGPKNLDKDKLYDWDYNKIFNKFRQLTSKGKLNYFLIDTALVRRLKKLNILEQLNIEPNQIYDNEGIFSKYVDMVEQFVSPSSYETQKRKYFKTAENAKKLIFDSSLNSN
jgi:MoaA/NifB/PqqE/SkfB family radical SAM enzyme